MAKINNKIHETDNYKMFKTLKGNRKVAQGHVARLRESIKRRDLRTPILVNAKMEIIDGQHKFQAYRSLKLPVRYMVADDFSLPEVQQLNTNNKNWTAVDFAKSYAENGNKNYAEYLKFRNKYQFPHVSALILLNPKNVMQIESKHKADFALRSFKDGGFKIADMNQSYVLANKVQDFSIYSGFRRRYFIIACLTLFATDGYKHAEMKEKMQYLGTRLQHFICVKDYLRCLEEIYNFKLGTKRKIRLF